MCLLILAFLPSCMGNNSGAFMQGFADGMNRSSSYDYAASARERRMERRQRELEDRLDRQEREMRKTKRLSTGLRLY